MNSPAQSATARKGKAAPLRTAWELPDLVQPLHRRRTRFVKQPRLLPHYPAVVEFIYNHRYAASFQIQLRFSDFMPNQRTSQYQLASLVDLGCLQRAPVRSTSPNFPAVFAATRRGIGLVKQTYSHLGVEWQGIATEQLKSSGVALDSILHELLLTELDQAVWSMVQSRGDLALVMHERRYFRNDKQLEYESHGKRHHLVPDAGFLLRLQPFERPEATLQKLQMNFVEFDNGSLCTARLAAKYRAYDEWSKSKAGQQYLRQLYERHGVATDRPNFRLLVIVRNKICGSDDRRLIDLFTLALDLPRTMRERIWLTTVAALRPQTDIAVLESPLWARLRDARPWLPRLRTLPIKGNFKRFAAWKAFVTTRLPELPRHSLLPQPH